MSKKEVLWLERECGAGRAVDFCGEPFMVLGRLVLECSHGKPRKPVVANIDSNVRMY